MNIEQIAQEVADELLLGGKSVGNEPAEFLQRCLSKLAKHGVEPVAEVLERNLRANDGDVWTERYVTWLKRAKHGDKLYTEAQLIAAQQKVAEACAKVCEKYAYDDDDFVIAIRNGEWRKYL